MGLHRQQPIHGRREIDRSRACTFESLGMRVQYRSSAFRRHITYGESKCIGRRDADGRGTAHRQRPDRLDGIVQCVDLPVVHFRRQFALIEKREAASFETNGFWHACRQTDHGRVSASAANAEESTSSSAWAAVSELLPHANTPSSCPRVVNTRGRTACALNSRLTWLARSGVP